MARILPGKSWKEENVMYDVSQELSLVQKIPKRFIAKENQHKKPSGYLGGGEWLRPCTLHFHRNCCWRQIQGALK